MADERPRAGPLLAQRPARRSVRSRSARPLGGEPRGRLLIAKGFRILARRWRSPVGEIDIVARRRGAAGLRRGEGARTARRRGRSVTERQQRRIIAAAEAWLARIPTTASATSASTPCWSRRGRMPRHIPAAFDASSVNAAFVRRTVSSRRAQLLRRTASTWPRMRGGDLAEIVGDRSSPRRRCRGSSAVASPTRTTSSAVSVVRRAAVSTLRAISWVAAPCSVTAAAIAPLISPISRMVRSIAPIASIERMVACCMPAICAPISSVALAVWPASAFTSLATTAKPRPASPARAASMVALSASRLVCSAMSVMSLTTSPMRPAASLSSLTVALVRSASLTALLAMAFDCATWRSISVHRGGKLVGRGRDVAHIGRRFARRRRSRPPVRSRRCRRRRSSVARRRQHLIGDAAELGQRGLDLGAERG